MDSRILIIAAAGAGLLWYLSRQGAATKPAIVAPSTGSALDNHLATAANGTSDLASLLGAALSHSSGGTMGDTQATTNVQTKPVAAPADVFVVGGGMNAAAPAQQVNTVSSGIALPTGNSAGLTPGSRGVNSSGVSYQVQPNGAIVYGV